MFRDDNDAFKHHDSCLVCRWKSTTMCPRDSGYVGRPISDSISDPYSTKICHRFVVTNWETERRWKLTMEKLHQNL